MDESTVANYLALRHSTKLTDSAQPSESAQLTERDFARLLKQHGSMAELLANEPIAARALTELSETAKRLIEQEQEWAAQANRHLIFFESPEYPPLLREIDCPPPVLAVCGRKCLLTPQIAIVGSRNCSHYGQRTARWLGKELAQLGLTITSGLALGIDTCAHEGALASTATDAATLAVIGNGLDTVYPKRNHNLAARLVERGALVSEFPLGTPALPGHFPRRNRIISGMSEGVIVIEAAIKSGSLITARQALEQNRELFAVPGQINSAHSEGCHWLITNGAKLLSKPGDVLAELSEQTLTTLRESNATSTLHNGESREQNSSKGSRRRSANRNLGDIEESIKAAGTHQQTQPELTDPQCRHLLALLQGEDMLFDELLQRSRMSTDALTACLLQLQILGRIEMQAGRILSLD